VIEEEGVITSRKLIFRRYLKGALIIDILAIFPFSLIIQGSSAGRSNVFIRFLRMARLVRIIRASKLQNILKYFTSEDGGGNMAKYQGIARMVSAVFVVLLLAHFTA
jgi:hypothetical protein